VRDETASQMLAYSNGRWAEIAPGTRLQAVIETCFDECPYATYLLGFKLVEKEAETS